MSLFRKKKEVYFEFHFEGIVEEKQIQYAQPIWDELGSMPEKQRKELMSHPLELMKFLEERGAKLTDINYS